MTHRALVVAITLLLVTAGCLGSTPSSDGTTTVTPDGEDSVEETTTTPTPFVENAPVDAERIAEAHAAALRDAQSFTRVVTVESQGANGTGNVSSSVGLESSLPARTAVDLDRGRIRASADVGFVTTSEYVSFDAGKTYRRMNAGNESQTTYVVTNVSERSLTAASADELLGNVEQRTRDRIATANFTVAGVEEHRGARVTRLVARGVSNHSFPETNATSVENATTVVLVGPDGLVHRVAERRTVEFLGATTEYTMVVEYTELGETTVEEPDWLDDARNQSEIRGS